MKIFKNINNEGKYKIYQNIIGKCICGKCGNKYDAIPLFDNKLPVIHTDSLKDFELVGER